MELLGEEGKKLQKKQDLYKLTEEIIKKHESELCGISEKSRVYFHESTDFNTYFENSKLNQHKDVLHKTIAVYDDKTIQNVDVLFTVDGIVPVVRNRIKDTIPYLYFASESLKTQILGQSNTETNIGDKIATALSVMFVPPLLMLGAALDTKAINNITSKLQPMIDEICIALLSSL